MNVGDAIYECFAKNGCAAYFKKEYRFMQPAEVLDILKKRTGTALTNVKSKLNTLIMEQEFNRIEPKRKEDDIIETKLGTSLEENVCISALVILMKAMQQQSIDIDKMVELAKSRISQGMYCEFCGTGKTCNVCGRGK